MPGLEQCLSVLAFPGDDAQSLSNEEFDAQITAHKSRVDQLVEKENADIKKHAMELLKQLDTCKHTYSFLSILDTIIPTDSSLYPTLSVALRSCMARITHTFDLRQVRYIGHALTRVIGVIATGLIMPHATAVKCITCALLKIDPTGHMLTSNHLALAKLAYNTNTGDLAMPALGKYIVFFPTTNAPPPLSEPLCSPDLPLPTYISQDTGLTLPITSSQVMEYDYFVGSIQLHLGNYDGGIAAYARVVSYPSRDGGVSKIMVAAHKRWIMASLIHTGKADHMPPLTSPNVARALASVNKIYTRMAELFQSASPADLCAEMALAADQLKANQDWSLVKEVVAWHKKWQIVRLKDVYTTISIIDLVTTLKVPEETAAAMANQNSELAEASRTPTTESEAMALIRDMIDSKMISAEIVTPEHFGPYLSFLSENHWSNETEFSFVLRKSKAEMERLRSLNALTEEHLSLNRDYLKQVMKDQKAAAKQDGLEEGGRARYNGFDAELDEDLMMDGYDHGY